MASSASIRFMPLRRGLAPMLCASAHNHHALVAPSSAFHRLKSSQRHLVRAYHQTSSCYASARRGDHGASISFQHSQLPDLKLQWEIESDWAGRHSALGQQALAEGGTRCEVRRRQLGLWLAAEFSDCARRGTILENAEPSDVVGPNSRKYPTYEYLTLDSACPSVILALSMVVDAPAETLQAGPAPDVIEAAEKHILATLDSMVQGNSNLDHAEAHIVIGSDMLRCRIKSFRGYTITPVEDGPSSREQEAIAKVCESANLTRGLLKFMPYVFQGVVYHTRTYYPGCTPWDEGELPFDVTGVPYAHATRVITARDCSHLIPNGDMEIFRLLEMQGPFEDQEFGFLRNLNPTQDVGEIVGVTMIVGLPKDAPWTECGTYTNTPTIKAAEAALLEYVKGLNREGKVQRCAAEVVMGNDRVKFSFVGEKFPRTPVQPTTGASSRTVYPTLEGFSLKLEQRKVRSPPTPEAERQIMPPELLNLAAHNPQKFRELLLEFAKLNATKFLQLNYPGRSISDEGPLPVEVVDNYNPASDTAVLVASDPSRAERNIVSVIATAPLPAPGKIDEVIARDWTGTHEMNLLIDSLLNLLKKWHSEGRISEIDCMAQVVVGLTHRVFKFVDGKFESYSDEQIQQLQWPIPTKIS
ncbi:hypothetical protein BX600DRAFT_437804 [Xylariales sp. PMI_506]|nr:hypothetical protein BX600DRAFT_437804 [Xylariales sp. PMI_506]